MFCADIPSPFLLIFSESAPTLLYYSHLPIIFTALLVGLLIYSRSKFLESKLLLTVVTAFGLWILVDLINWANVDSRIIMVSWSMMNFFFLVVLASLIYFSYTFLRKKEPPALVFFLGMLPLVVYLLFLPTHFNLTGFDLSICEATEGPLTGYFRILQVAYLVWLVLFLAHESYVGMRQKNKLPALFSLGVGFFAVSFFAGNVIAIIFDNWELEQYGLFGVLVFLVLLVFLIVKYEVFSIKILGAQVLVVALIILIGSQFFFIQTDTNRILTAITLFLAAGFGWFLIKSVQQEVKRKEELETLTAELSVANKELKRLDSAKSEFISIASHQLRTPLTAIRGFLSLLLEGAYGALEPKIAETLNKVTIANNRLMSLVENLLNISRIEAGRIQYQMELTQIESIVEELESMFALAAKEKGLSLVVHRPASPLPQLRLDSAKIREVLSNLIDNSFKYTEQGSITIAFESDERWVRVSITDTGMGIDPRDMDHLFKKFERGSRTERVNVSSTGLGLYVGRKFAEAHGGTIRALSAGRGKGATFILELPIPGEESAL